MNLWSATHVGQTWDMVGWKPEQRDKQERIQCVEGYPFGSEVVSDWETEIVFLPFELGIQVCYPAGSILNDFDPAVPHPVVEAYKAYLPMPYDRPCWDPAALVYAVEGEKYFDISPYGVIAINDEGTTSFTADQKGLHRYLMIDSEKAGKLTARIVELLTSK